MDHPKPTRQDLENARHKTVRDVIKPRLKILFAGINPGLYTAAIGHHFGRPGNRFWPALYGAGFTSRLLTPYDEREILKDGYGITNVVSRTTASAAELTEEEIREGGKVLVGKVKRLKPEMLAVLGVGAYRIAFSRPRAQVGLQKETIGTTRIWVLPNPSGLNANFQLADIVALLKKLRQ